PRLTDNEKIYQASSHTQNCPRPTSLPLLTIPIYPFILFFFNDTATTEIYTLSLHDALPISIGVINLTDRTGEDAFTAGDRKLVADRKSTRLNSSHVAISYAVFCLKKKNIAREAQQARAAWDRTVFVPLRAYSVWAAGASLLR